MVKVYEPFPEAESIPEGWPAQYVSKADYDRLGAMVDALLNHCPKDECGTCGEIVCPHGEPLHFHHDGCPACYVPPQPLSEGEK